MRRAVRKTVGAMTTFMFTLFIAAANPACAKGPEAKKPASSSTSKQAATAPAQQPAAQPQAAPASAANSAQQQPEVQSQPTPAAPEKKADTKVDVYLFHGTYRCYSCNLMEELAVEAINEQLAKEKENGQVVFQHLNIEEPQNRHFIDDYRLAAISIILSQKSGGKEKQWKNLDQVWTLLRDRERFKDYVVKEIRNYLKG